MRDELHGIGRTWPVQHVSRWWRALAAVTVVGAIAVSGLGVSSASAVVNAHANGATFSTVAKAQPDECWNPSGTPTDMPMPANGQCPTGYQAKVNQAYVWGETTAGDNIFFGTAPNVLCLVLGGYLGITQPMVVDGSWTCEFGSSPYSDGTYASVPAIIGDWRPPQLFEYNMATQTNSNLVTQQSSADQATITALLTTTLGIRSAGEAVNPLDASQTVVFLAGPSLSGTAINVFAFDQGGHFLGATTLTDYNDIRAWLTVPDGSSAGQSLFAGVQTTAGSVGDILQWTPTSPTDYFDFTVVGTTPSETANLAAASDRIFATTWPNAGHEAGLYVSPVSTNGFADGALDGSAWSQLWTASDYEPDPLIARTYGGGALAVYDGYVYWGTMHVPFVATGLLMGMYPPSGTVQALADVVNTQRSVSIFRLPADESGPAQLLYGNSQLPVYNGSSWELEPNNMGGVHGLYGSSGLGNPFNNYTWSMAVYDGQLYVGTMDWSYLLYAGWPDLAQAFGLPSDTPNPFGLLSPGFGADLVEFPDTSSPAQVVSISGLGNSLSYGVRNMVSVMSAPGPENGLYLGMANPMNLATSGPDQGGWELVKLNVTGQNFSLDLAPLTQSQAVNSPASVTATLTQDGQPLASVPVTFTVATGPDAGTTRQVVTNSAGVAVFQWTGTQLGEDVVQAVASPVVSGQPVPIGATSTATVDWVTPSVVVPVTPTSAPTVTSVSPNTGLAAGGTTVTITGTGFATTGTTVSFGTAAASSVSCSSSTTCTAVAPAGSGTVDVTVTVNGATSALSTGDHFTYQATAAAGGGTSCASYSGNSAWICSVYVDLFGRTPDNGGLATWGSLLGSGVSRSSVAATITQSQEYRNAEVHSLYASDLGRAPDSAGLASFLGMLNTGATDEQVATLLLASPEFFAKAGGTNAGFVTALYQHVLGRAPDASGLAAWTAALAGGVTRGQVAASVLSSLEYRSDLVAGWYSKFLNRAVDPTGLATWTAALGSGVRDEGVIASILGSSEYLALVG